MNEGFTARIAEAYSRHSEKYASILEPMLRPTADEVVGLGRLVGGELVLDLATGTGLIARTAAQFTKAVIGIDISLGVLGRARTLSAGAIPFVAGDAHGLPFKDAAGRFCRCSGLHTAVIRRVSQFSGSYRSRFRLAGHPLPHRQARCGDATETEGGNGRGG